MRANPEKIKAIGPDAYRVELDEKIAILHALLAHYNDGRQSSKASS